MKVLLLLVQTIHKTVIALKGFPEDQYLNADTQQTDLVCLCSWFSGNCELIQCSELYVSLCKHAVLLKQHICCLLHLELKKNQKITLKRRFQNAKATTLVIRLFLCC